MAQLSKGSDIFQILHFSIEKIKDALHKMLSRISVATKENESPTVVQITKKQ